MLEDSGNKTEKGFLALCYRIFFVNISQGTSCSSDIPAIGFAAYCRVTNRAAGVGAAGCKHEASQPVQACRRKEAGQCLHLELLLLFADYLAQ